nr:hypothetical protein [Tanacetum cinerariifolium]
MEAHCIALELKSQNQALKLGQHGQVLNDEGNNAKIKKEIDVLETNNIELEYKIQEKVFAIAALKNDLRKLKGNSVDTKFANTSVLGKSVLQPLRNKSVVRQPNACKHERPQMSKQRFASQVDVNHNVSKPVTQHFLPKKSESAFAKPDHMIASSSSRNNSKNMPRFNSNDMASAHNSSDPALSRQVMASVQNSTDPGPTCQNKALVQISFDPAPECQTMALEHGSLSPRHNCQENVSHRDKTGTTSNELDLLFSPMFDELLNGSSKVVSQSSAVAAADAPNQRQQPITPLNIHTTPVPTCQNPPITTSVISSENINQA